MLRLPEHDWRASRRLRPDRSGHDDAAGAGPDELLHLVPHPGQGFLQQGPEGSQDRRVPEVAVRRDARPAARWTRKSARCTRCAPQGHVLGAFATIAIDNPMMAATGHRICNDCMKACIYQKQEPVDIPQAETSILKDVLALPWGFEIYALLTRWNPLDIRRPLPRPDSGRKVLIVGLGPAGFTLAHHLMNDGHTVVAIDGLKIEPLRLRSAAAPVRDVGDAVRESRRSRDGRVRRRRRIRHHRALEQELPETGAPAAGAARGNSRISAASASAAARRCRSTTPGRWASTTSRCAWAPASRPCSISRTASRAACAQASDFLMALQLTGAAKTVVDRQSAASPAGRGHRRRPDGDRHRDREPRLLRPPGGEIRRCATACWSPNAARRAVRAAWTAEEAEVADEFLAHAAAIGAERAGRGARRPRAASGATARRLGRRHHRLSPPADRQPRPTR